MKPINLIDLIPLLGRNDSDPTFLQVARQIGEFPPLDIDEQLAFMSFRSEGVSFALKDLSFFPPGNKPLTGKFRVRIREEII
jgi:hypothetical protein